MDRDNHSTDKGKSKATYETPERQEVPSNESKGTSLPSRLVSSAYEVAKHLTSVREASPFLSSLATGSGKEGVRSSGPSESALEGSSGARVRASSSHRDQETSHLNQSRFRSDAGEFASEEELRTFLADNPEFAGLQNPNHNPEDQSHQWISELTRTNGNASDIYALEPRHDDKDTLDDTFYDDGAEVRRLLSDPNFVALSSSDDYAVDDLSAASAASLFPPPVLDEEKEAADWLRQDLPRPPEHGQVAGDHPLNLIPDLSILDVDASEGLDAETLEMQRRQMVEQWAEVLDSYTDSVWGDLLPTVQEAREQLKEVKSGKATLDEKAVARLRMLLGHVNGLQMV